MSHIDQAKVVDAELPGTALHSPAPWTFEKSGCEEHNNITHYINAPSDQMNGGFILAEVSGPDQEANARRIVACVNACEGIPTHVLIEVEKFVVDSCIPYLTVVKRLEEATKAERAWETSMMHAIGEDGPGSVAQAIQGLKADRTLLLETLKIAQDLISNRWGYPADASSRNSILADIKTSIDLVEARK